MSENYCLKNWNANVKYVTIRDSTLKRGKYLHLNKFVCFKQTVKITGLLMIVKRQREIPKSDWPETRFKRAKYRELKGFEECQTDREKALDMVVRIRLHQFVHLILFTQG
jgi:hypothetical protein